MKTFHGKQSVKDKYISRVKAHAKADRIIQGKGWENGKGCAVGCTLEDYKHSQYPIELGVPEWLAHLEDVIFEGLDKKEALYFPLEFLEAIPVGVNETELYKLRCDLDYQRLSILLENLQEENDEWGVESAIRDVMALKLEYVPFEDIRYSAAKSAANSAYSAYSAYSAAESAAYSAKSAANSAAESTAYSAESAAYSAESAANSAAWQGEKERLIAGLKKLKAESN